MHIGVFEAFNVFYTVLKPVSRL
ncbi:hypothetical protein KPLM21_600017 [Klebsiella pneumoniae]|nr:hypothetical protein KPLM21_600017 [Klebsiella pneumoniae]